MLFTTLLLIHDQVGEASAATTSALAIRAIAPDAPRGLLATVVSVEDAAFHLAYTAVVGYALGLDTAGRPVAVDLLHPLATLAPPEQAALRAALIAQSWSAWARAPLPLRALLGDPEPPVLLADAARQIGLPLPTLANAAGQERLPTIRAGDRHLVYLATIREALDRGLLHLARGRPRRGGRR